MTTIQSCAHDKEIAGYDSPAVEVDGHSWSSRFDPMGASLWSMSVRLSASTLVAWVGDHSDEAVWVRSGVIEVDGSRCGPGTAAVIESEARPQMRVIEDAVVFHVGSTEPNLTSSLIGPPAPGRDRTHVIAPEWSPPVGGDPSIEFYADSYCDTCRISFFTVVGADEYRSPSHVHSEAEIIHVIRGELRIGRVVVPQRHSVFVPAGVRYGFQTAGAFEFLNYRRDASMCTLRPGSNAFLEAGRHGRTPDEPMVGNADGAGSDEPVSEQI